MCVGVRVCACLCMFVCVRVVSVLCSPCVLDCVLDVYLFYVLSRSDQYAHRSFNCLLL